MKGHRDAGDVARISREYQLSRRIGGRRARGGHFMNSCGEDTLNDALHVRVRRVDWKACDPYTFIESFNLSSAYFSAVSQPLDFRKS